MLETLRVLFLETPRVLLLETPQVLLLESENSNLLRVLFLGTPRLSIRIFRESFRFLDLPLLESPTCRVLMK